MQIQLNDYVFIEETQLFGFVRGFKGKKVLVEFKKTKDYFSPSQIEVVDNEEDMNMIYDIITEI